MSPQTSSVRESVISSTETCSKLAQCPVHCIYRWQHICARVVKTFKTSLITEKVCVSSLDWKFAPNDLLEAVKFWYFGRVMLQEMPGYQLYCADTHSGTYTRKRYRSGLLPWLEHLTDTDVVSESLRIYICIFALWTCLHEDGFP